MMSASEKLRELETGVGGAPWVIDVEIRNALPEIIAVIEAAEKIQEPDDYWDWVTGHAPQCKAALAALEDKLAR